MAKKEKTTEIVDQETGEVTFSNVFAEKLAEEENKTATAEAPKKRKKETVISGAEYWKFAPEKEGGVYDGETFVGYFRALVKREKDGPKADVDKNHKAGAVIGYDFEQEGTGEHYIISSSHAIQKALEKKEFNSELLFEIVFLGKGVTSGNQPYNRFEVSVLLDE